MFAFVNHSITVWSPLSCSDPFWRKWQRIIVLFVRWPSRLLLVVTIVGGVCSILCLVLFVQTDSCLAIELVESHNCFVVSLLLLLLLLLAHRATIVPGSSGGGCTIVLKKS